MRSLRIVVAAVSMTASLSAQSPDSAGKAGAGEAMLTALSLRDAGLVVLREDGELHRSVHGTIAADEAMPIGAASRWLTVATILALVDEKKLDLDLPVARYVEEFDHPDKQMITLRQCLSCTAGFASDLRKNMNDWNMKKFAAEAGDVPVREHPGSAFRDSDVGFQIAAVAAERVTGEKWHEVFAGRIARRLDMKHTSFGGMQPLGEDAGSTPLPWAGSGAVSSIDDYARFVRMLVGKGRFDEREVLKEATVAMMWRDQVAPNVDVRAKWFEGERLRYGLGAWIEVLGDDTVRVTSPSEQGFVPWVDLDLGLGGVCAARARGQWMEKLHDLQCDVRAAVLSPAVAGTMEVVKLKYTNLDRRYTVHVPPKHGQDAMPLLLVLHCDGGSADQVSAVTGFAEAGVRAGFVVVFPEGSTSRLRKLLGWNARNDGIVDDIGFLREVVADVKRRVSIDPARVYACGRGGGGKMCHRIARQAADVFTGIAAIDGAMTWTLAEATTPLAVLLVHATDAGAPEWTKSLADAHAIVPVDQALAYYLALNGLVDRPDTTQEENVRFDKYTVGKDGKQVAPVSVITIEGGRHTWPGAKKKGAWLAAASGSRFDATETILEFFKSLSGKSPAPAPPAQPGVQPR